MTTIRLPRLDRVLALVVFGPVWIGTGIALVSVAFVPGSSAHVFVVVLGAVFVAGGIWTSSRVPRVGVQLTEDTLRYDGYLLSWSAPRAGVSAVLDDGFVEWHDGAGAEHRRQIWMLTQARKDDGSRFARYWLWRREALLDVRQWAGARGV